ncbi:MAG: YtxH domain-containing protein [Bacteroidales bacterium]
MEKSNHTGSLVGGILLGAMAGAALGVLFAPHKGSKTRSNIADGAKSTAQDIKKKMKKEVKDIRRKAEEQENLAKEKAEGMKESAQKKAEKQ